MPKVQVGIGSGWSIEWASGGYTWFAYGPRGSESGWNTSHFKAEKQAHAAHERLKEPLDNSTDE